MKIIVCVLLIVASAEITYGQNALKTWSFEKPDLVQGLYRLKPGVTGHGLELDGYTTVLSDSGITAASIKDGITIEAWVALRVLPWNWTAIAAQQKGTQGFFLGLDYMGRPGFHASVNGKWITCNATEAIEQREWVHLMATQDPDKGMALYVNGKLLAENKAQGSISLPASDIIIGRNVEPSLPVGSLPRCIWTCFFSIDGILDEISISNHWTSEEQAEIRYKRLGDLPKPDTILPRLPVGKGREAGRFGANYCELKFFEPWDRPWRTGKYADVVVNFEDNETQLLVWRGTGYFPSLVTENNIWYVNQSDEIIGADPTNYEPMHDKQCRYSNVRIIENNEARVVLHWRYAITGVDYSLKYGDDTGWDEWADEYWTVYPDGQVVRKLVVWTGAAHFDAIKRQVQESLILHEPGRIPEDNLETNAVTLMTIDGEKRDFSWPHTRGKPAAMGHGLKNPCIQIVNTKSEYKPYTICLPSDTIDYYCFNRRSMPPSIFSWYKHWPVAKLPSYYAAASTGERTTCSTVGWFTGPGGRLQIPHVEQGEKSKVWVMLTGLSNKSEDDVAKIARAWSRSPKMTTETKGVKVEEYDIFQKAFIVSVDKMKAMRLSLHPSEESPVYNPAILIRNWDSAVKLTVNGVLLSDKDYKSASIRNPDSTDLLLWLKTQSSDELNIDIALR